MKKLFLVAAAAVLTFGFSSCNNQECCDMGTCDQNIPGWSGDVCEDDLEDAPGITWGEWRDAAKDFGCDCD